MAALVKERRRFGNIALRTLLRSSSPRASRILSEALQPPARFDGGNLTSDTTQCIPRRYAKKGSQMEVSLDDCKTVHRAMYGTPIVDGYLNLRFRSALSSDIAIKTLFIQYKHSGLMSQSSAVHISHMNQEVNKLAAVSINMDGRRAEGGSFCGSQTGMLYETLFQINVFFGWTRPRSLNMPLCSELEAWFPWKSYGRWMTTNEINRLEVKSIWFWFVPQWKQIQSTLIACPRRLRMLGAPWKYGYRIKMQR